MKTKMPARKWLSLVAGASVCCALNLPAQTAPSITSQPTSQTVLAGSNVTFSVAVSGTGPLTYHWQFNGTDLPNNIITTVAGNGSPGYAGDGQAATNASMSDPRGLTFDAAGNLYIADQFNNCVRKVNTNGIIATVVGNGTPGYSGDGGLATNATLRWANGVVVDAAGNLYVEDCKNFRVRKVDTNGIITTFAGNGTMPYPPADGVQATNSSLRNPSGLALDATGNLYIADEGDGRIRKVDTNGIISTVAGGGTGRDGGAATNAYLSMPMGEAMDPVGNLYIADQDNNRIRKVGTNGIITTAAGNGIIAFYYVMGSYSGDGGEATNAGLNNPWAVAFDASSNLYIADCLNNRIRMVDTNGIITTVAGNGSPGYAGDGGAATNASLNGPCGLGFDASGNLYIVDQTNNCIREVHFAGFPTLTLSNVLAGNAGSYSVVVTSPYGSVTGAVSTVNVAASAPQIMTSDGYFGFLTNQFGFNLSGALGQTIVVDGSADLVNWTPLITNICGSGNPFYFCDPCWTNYPWRFYRARLQ